MARAAARGDAESASRTLARAFLDDPLFCYFLPNDRTRAGQLQRLFRLLFRIALCHGACNVSHGVEAVALWLPPGQWRIPFYRYIIDGPEFLRIFGPIACLHALGGMDHIERSHPRAPHFYLQTLGTDPDHQGKGFAGSVMRRQLAFVDAARMPVYLESSKERNIPFYRSFGFDVTGEIVLPGGPTLHSMWRPPEPD
jgi:GNAT superfamily N-acetyltransferase